MNSVDRLFVEPERLAWLWLVLAVVLAIIAGEFLRTRWRRRLFALAYKDRAAKRCEPQRWLLCSVRAVALVLIVLALADPRAGMAAIEVKTSKLQIVCLLDRSRSMLAPDTAPSRFEAGRNVVRDVVDSAAGAAVALVTFAGDARIDVPLTRDYQSLLDRLEEVAPDNIPFSGTNFGAGLVTAATCFAERIESPKLLIVVTDGETHGIDPELPEGLLPPGTEVLIVGVGDSQRGARIPLNDDDPSNSGDTHFLTHEGKTVRSRANPELLRRIAEQLDGRFQMIDANSSTADITDAVRRVESTATEEERLAYRRQAAPRFHWFLLAAAGLLCLEAILPLKKQARFRLPRFARSGSTKHTVLWILFSVSTTPVALADEPPGTTVTSQSRLCPKTGASPYPLPQIAREARFLRWNPKKDASNSGERELKSRFATSFFGFWTGPSGRELTQTYNRGVEAYRAGRWSDAERRFRTVSRQAEGSLKTKAMFNLANTHYMIANRGGISKREAISRLEAATGLFRQVIAEGERTEDARANIEIVYRRLLQIQQQQPDSAGDEPPEDDTTDDGAQNGSDNRDESGDDESGDTEPNENGAAPPGGQGSGGQPQGNGSPTGDNGESSGQPDAGDSSGSGRSGAGRPREEITEPLTDQQAEDQLNRIRQRAQDRRKEKDKDDSADAAPIPSPSGLPW